MRELTINELITKLSDSPREFGDVWIEGEHVEQIIALLRIGQAMRDNLFDATKEWKLNEALKAWDAATKGDEG